MTEEIVLARHSGPRAGIQTIESFWIAAYATMTEEIKLGRHSGPVLASNSRSRIAQRFLPLPVLAPILRKRDALRFLPSLAGEGLRMGAIGGRTKDGGD